MGNLFAIYPDQSLRPTTNSPNRSSRPTTALIFTVSLTSFYRYVRIHLSIVLLVYYMQSVPAEAKFARELHERIRREFPELRIYRFWDKPVGMFLILSIVWYRYLTTKTCFLGPHPVAMFEVNVFNPHQTGALFSWLTVNRGPCSYVPASGLF